MPSQCKIEDRIDKMPASSLAGSLPQNTIGLATVVIETVLLLLGYSSIGLRLWSRRLLQMRLQANDYLILIAALVYVLDLHWLTLVTLVKLSILHFYSVVFRGKDAFAKVVYGVMAIVIAYWMGTFWADAFLCNPPRKAMYTAMASADLIIDIIVILLPMPILWTLQLKTSKKVLLTAVFGLGFFIIGITCVRIKYMLELDPTDITYTFAPLALIAAIVPLLGIINASLPTLRPALEKMFGPKLSFGDSGGNSERRRWYKYHSRDAKNVSGTEESNKRRRNSDTEFPLVTIGDQEERNAADVSA
ncbi:hypothetical protein DHEL01_v212308 [Diaporthe helianthi]|uniref:Rhodopsin domain-containing protein n=1 Tax=Diaporthe helianthi TaxID=158607 RepID=A0A2P5HGB4_DIAHE|nr:hypothetical protein DHEL01_v212308 [Diaporthe helianthi]